MYNTEYFWSYEYDKITNITYFLTIFFAFQQLDKSGDIGFCI